MIALRTLTSPQSSNYDLVLIHAFPLASAMYDDAVKELQKDRPDLTVHLVDLPGFGNAPYREHWTIAEAMRSLHEILQEKKIVSPIIGGTSMGGYAVLAYARQYPQEVSGLILSNTKAGADSEEAKQGRFTFAREVGERGHEPVYERMLDKLISAASVKRDPNLREKVKRWIADIEPKAIIAALYALANRDDSMDLLESIETPTLIIVSEDDTLIPPEESKKMQIIRDSHVITMEGTAHLAVVEQPATWAETVLNFMQSTVGSPI